MSTMVLICWENTYKWNYIVYHDLDMTIIDIFTQSVRRMFDC